MPLTQTRNHRRDLGLCTDCCAPSPDRYRCPDCTATAKERRKQRDRMLHREKYQVAKSAPPAPAPEKLCPLCQTSKPGSEFARNIVTPDGLYGICKDCRRVRNREYHAKAKINRWARDLVNFARARAIRDNREFAITEDDVLTIFKRQGGVCYWYGVPLVPSLVRSSPQKPSIDRLDCNIGYTPENVVLSCMAANLGRSVADPVVFRQFCDLLRSRP